ncbi:MAG: phosphatidylglycerophosphatase A [Alphaproteobacteria bacterium]|jgi:phosphatidylglycerophosphatase A|nr:phosphatidylglycerophosphatase A [Rhodospirillaceae bacterium]MBT6204493.1 phosphatidylglycerophosphatase A [Rhodospirillaceae bacterium]MBT6512781.1 phosphatidylglycerophosphatase A [Rhodospirillaceae bacterium]MBT7613774.1 phosphatidylglycerophosphatase A [Rhodospirillaceae bacterium]MDG2479819.1 phosphatidylglycerophosphatase A [Alphaproteobacteria bacterium]
MDVKRLPDGVGLRTPGALVATWFGVGLIRPAPGTWGSVAALPLGVGILYLAGPWGLLGAAVAIFAFGTWETHRLIRGFPDDAGHDHASIVVDEVAGQLIALIPALFSPLLWLAAFLLFRLFDIWKPGPIGMLDRKVPGALGVMLDDVAAGVAAALCVFALSYLVP